jgi:hypothetical protein
MELQSSGAVGVYVSSGFSAVVASLICINGVLENAYQLKNTAADPLRDTVHFRDRCLGLVKDTSGTIAGTAYTGFRITSILQLLKNSKIVGALGRIFSWIGNVCFIIYFGFIALITGKSGFSSFRVYKALNKLKSAPEKLKYLKELVSVSAEEVSHEIRKKVGLKVSCLSDADLMIHPSVKLYLKNLAFRHSLMSFQRHCRDRGIPIPSKEVCLSVINQLYLSKIPRTETGAPLDSYTTNLRLNQELETVGKELITSSLIKQKHRQLAVCLGDSDLIEKIQEASLDESDASIHLLDKVKSSIFTACAVNTFASIVMTISVAAMIVVCTVTPVGMLIIIPVLAVFLMNGLQLILDGICFMFTKQSIPTRWDYLLLCISSVMNALSAIVPLVLFTFGVISMGPISFVLLGGLTLIWLINNLYGLYRFKQSTQRCRLENPTDQEILKVLNEGKTELAFKMYRKLYEIDEEGIVNENIVSETCTQNERKRLEKWQQEQEILQKLIESTQREINST